MIRAFSASMLAPPTRLVVQGLFRYVRNPMYLGVCTAVWFVVVNLFVVLYEEPSLRRRFGDQYGL